MEETKVEIEIKGVEKGVSVMSKPKYGSCYVFKLRKMSAEAIERYGLQKYVGDGG